MPTKTFKKYDRNEEERRRKDLPYIRK